MFPQYGQLILKPQLCCLSFHHAVILLLLIDIKTGQSETVTPSQTIITLVGEDVILPCHLEPPSDAVSEILEWGRPDLDPRFVHVWYEGQNHLVNQNPSYKGRTSLSTEKLKQGDLSLKLTRVKHSDNGRYRCFFPSEHKESITELLVGSLSLPTISGININTSRVVLQCESAGWYPEPELLWLDGEGNLLSAGPTETLRGPDDLYTVSSRVTVEKRHKNSFTCRVQQRDMKQSRETQIHVSERKRQKVEELLVAESKKSEELQKKDEELKDLAELINILMKQQIDLKEVKDKLGDQSNTFASEVENLGTQFLAVDKITEKDRVSRVKTD
ncbi:butyrophilin subfamily 1 member A1-like [Simochromis diagramma]|uniref:butyrophilin subfamily 1 member A1-like n=1 Tax=Simochromis diagramma TaxID=43689 RepID=UPI001A7ECDCA|nr:butyrophilin subfamily 1 member A1-like [Simochromis diagramma]